METDCCYGCRRNHEYSSGLGNICWINSLSRCCECFNGAVISSVVEESAAEKGGLQAGDEIIYVQNGEESIKPESIDDVSEFIQYYKGETTFTILRDGEELKLTITPTYNEEQNVYQLGVYPQNEIKEISFLEAIPYGTQQ